MLQAVERYMKQCIVDKNASVSCAALVSSLHLAATSGDVVKRWANEAQEALNSDNIMVQYHALGLLYHIRKTDRLAVTKLVNRLIRQNLKSPYALCMLIRITSKLIEEDEAAGGSNDNSMLEFIEKCLREKSEMVVYEAAHALVKLKQTTARELAPAISILQLFCASPKATLRFAAVRTMNKVAIAHPVAITTCNLDLEGLITDSNRSVATLAITTLLKTGAESSVERLMKQIATFVAEISDEFKVVIVQAIKSLCTKFPRKHAIMINFLSQMLREEGGLDYKTSIVETMITIIEENVDAKEAGLSHLCEFIEDCEHTLLAVRILHLLGKEGPFSATPSKYIRFIYNRVILENATVRAAAVSALAQFGAVCPNLLHNILVLLGRCQMDTDDEVRDRATYYLTILQASNVANNNNYIIERPNISIPLLERALKDYITGPCTEHFDLATIPTTAPVQEEISHDAMIITSAVTKVPKVSREEAHAERLSHIPGIQSLGPIHKSAAPVQLTENETEYTVQCIKHTFARHMVFQFDCVNTLSDQLLQNVRVELDMPTGFTLKAVIPCEKLPYNEVNATYVIVEYPNDIVSSAATFSATLKFEVKDCDPATGLPDSDDTYNDEYMLEDLEITVADQIQKSKKTNFSAAWEAAESEGEYYHVTIDKWKLLLILPFLTDWIEVEDTYALSAVNTLQEAVNTILKFLGLGAANMTERVNEGVHTHSLLCSGMSIVESQNHICQQLIIISILSSGVYRGGFDILVQSKLALSEGVTMQLTVRSTNAEVAELLTCAIG